MERKRYIDSRLARLEDENKMLRARLNEVEEELSDGAMAEIIMDVLCEALPGQLDAMWSRLGPDWMHRLLERLYERLKADEDDADWWKRGGDGP